MRLSFLERRLGFLPLWLMLSSNSRVFGPGERVNCPLVVKSPTPPHGSYSQSIKRYTVEKDKNVAFFNPVPLDLGTGHVQRCRTEARCAS